MCFTLHVYSVLANIYQLKPKGLIIDAIKRKKIWVILIMNLVFSF